MSSDKNEISINILFTKKVSHFTKIKSSDVLNEIFKFFYLSDLLKFIQVNKRFRKFVNEKYLTPVFNKFQQWIEIKTPIKNISDLFFLSNYAHRKYDYSEFKIYFENKEKLNTLLIKYCLKLFNFGDSYEDKGIYYMDDKLTIYKNNYYCDQDLLRIFIRIKKITRLKDMSGVINKLLKEESLNLSELQLVNINYKDHYFYIGCSYKLNRMSNLKSLGIFDIWSEGAYHLMPVNMHINKVKITRRISDNEGFYLNNNNNKSKYMENILHFFPNLNYLKGVEMEYMDEDKGRKDLNYFLEDLLNSGKKLNKLKLKNLFLLSKDISNDDESLDNESFDEYNGYSDGESSFKQCKLIKTEFVYKLNEYQVNAKTFKVEGGVLKDFSLASDFLNVNENVEKLVLKDQTIREKDFINFLKNINKDSNIKIIKTEIKYSEHIIKTLENLNKKLNRNIRLLNFNYKQIL